jgi:tetratricopeptide (TPR) repeat protein
MPDRSIDSKSAEPELSSLSQRKMKILDRLDAIGTGFFSFLKIFIFMLLFLAMIFGLAKIITQHGGVVILPFEIGTTENLNSIAIADQLTAELMRIQQIHNFKNNDVILRRNNQYYKRQISAEQSLGNQKLIVPKAELVEFNMANLGTINLGPGSLDPGKLIIAFKGICPFGEPVTTIRGSLQRYGSAIVLVVMKEGNDNIQSWTIKQPIDKNNEEQIHEMIRNASFMIIHDLPQSNVSAKTWEGLKYYTEALEAYHQYDLSGNLDDLSLAGNYSLKAISSEKGYEKPFELLLLLETTYFNIGMQEKAIYYSDEALNSSPSAYAWNNKGYVLNVQGVYWGAIHAFDKAIDIDPHSTSALINKGLAFVGLNKNEVYYEQDISLYLDDAIQAFDKAIDIDPQCAEAWNYKGYALIRQGNFTGGINAFDKAIDIDPQYGEAWNNKGLALVLQGNYIEGIDAFDKAIDIDPQYGEAWNYKGYALIRQGNFTGGINAFDKAIDIDPQYGEAWNNKGLALVLQGNYIEGIDAFDKAIDIDPQYGEAWNYKGYALGKLNRTKKANEAYSKASELGLGSRRINGKVKLFNKAKSFGFITPLEELRNNLLERDDRKDIFFDITGIKPGITIDAGDNVSFEVIKGEKGPKADNIEKAG